MRSPRHYAVLLSVGIVTGVALGGSLAVFLVPGPVPGSLATDATIEVVHPSVVEFADPHDVRLTLTVDSSSGLRSAAGGTLTSLACVGGQQVASGASPFGVDGAAVVALATSVPPWRDIAVGDEGPDVAALEAELARVGAGLAPDSVWSWTDALALDAALGAVGVTTTDEGTVRLASIAWLPSPVVGIASCPVALGSSVGPGTVVAQFAPRLSLARFPPPADAVAGERALTLGTTTVPVGTDGVVAEPAALDAIAASGEFAEADPAQDPPVLRASWALVAPVPVTVLPPSAVYDVVDGTACVEDGRGAAAVIVIASQLGRTLVEPSRPLGAVLVHPTGTVPCS